MMKCLVALPIALFLLSYTPLLSQTQHSTKCDFLDQHHQDHIQKLVDGIQADRERPKLPLFVDSPTRRFRVHYTLDGPNAVPGADDDGNLVPDFVDQAIKALDRSWDLQITFGAALVPPSDGLAGGSSALDVYLIDLSKAGAQGFGLYGATVPDSLVADQPSVPYQRFTSWLEVDNDFSADDRNVFGNPVFATFGVEGLQITCAHELHHVTQFIRAGNARVQLMMYEMMATYMEMVCYPESNDWQVQLTRILDQPEGFPMSDPSSSNGYPWAWFLESFNEAEGADVMVTDVLDNIASGSRPFNAFVQSSSANQYPLDLAFVNALPALYATGERAANNTLILRAENLPPIKYFIDEVATGSSVIHSGQLRSFEVRALRFSVPSIDGRGNVTASVLLTWPDTTAFVQSEFVQTIPYTVTLTESPAAGDIPIAGTRWGLSIVPPAVASWVNNVAVQRPQAPYPLPVQLSSSAMVYVPVADAQPGENVTITLLTLTSIGVTETIVEVEIDGDRLIAPFVVPQQTTPGTYLLQVKTGASIQLHKVAIKR